MGLHRAERTYFPRHQRYVEPQTYQVDGPFTLTRTYAQLRQQYSPSLCVLPGRLLQVGRRRTNVSTVCERDAKSSGKSELRRQARLVRGTCKRRQRQE